MSSGDSVEVRFFAGLRDGLGQSLTCAVLTDAGTTIADILHKLPTGPKELNLDEGAEGCMRSDPVILLNGRNIVFLNGQETRLLPGDRISVFPPISGG